MIRFPIVFLAFTALSFSALAAEPLRVLVATDSAPQAEKFRAGLVRAQLKTSRRAGRSGWILAAPLFALDKTDVLVLFESEMKPLPASDRAALESFAGRGGGLVVLHGGVAAGDACLVETAHRRRLDGPEPGV